MKERRFTFGTLHRASDSNPWCFRSAFRSYKRTRPGVKIGRADQARAYALQMGNEALRRQWIGHGIVPLYRAATTS